MEKNPPPNLLSSMMLRFEKPGYLTNAIYDLYMVPNITASEKLWTMEFLTTKKTYLKKSNKPVRKKHRTFRFFVVYSRQTLKILRQLGAMVL